MKLSRLARGGAFGALLGTILLGAPATGWSQDKVFLPDASVTVIGGLTLRCADIAAPGNEAIAACWGGAVPVAEVDPAEVEPTAAGAEPAIVDASADAPADPAVRARRPYRAEAEESFGGPEPWIGPIQALIGLI